MTFDGRDMLVVEFRDISERLHRQHLMETQNWALGAYAVAALALGRVHSTEDLLSRPFVMALRTNRLMSSPGWGLRKKVRESRFELPHRRGMQRASRRAAMELGRRRSFGTRPDGVCIRTNTVQILKDAKKSPVSFPGRERARQLKVRSSISVPIPFSIEGGRRGALVVYSALPNAFEPDGD